MFQRIQDNTLLRVADGAVGFLARPYLGYFSVLLCLLFFAGCLFLAGRFIGLNRTRRLGSVALFVVNLSIAYWIVVEGYFRFAYDASNGFGIISTHARWMKRNVRLNSGFFRDEKEYLPLKGKSNLVFLIGDSVQVGQGIRYEETVAALLQEELGNYSFMNIAKPGINTDFQNTLLELLLDGGYRPELVILNYVLNDIDHGNRLASSYYLRNISLFTKLHFLRFTYSAQFLYAWSLAGKIGQDYEEMLIAAYNGAPFEEHAKKLLELLGLAKSIGARNFVVLWPVTPVQLHEEWNAARKKVIDFLKEEQIEFVDLYPLISGMSPSEQMANRFDHHPSGMVHGIAAHAIADRISDVPPP